MKIISTLIAGSLLLAVGSFAAEPAAANSDQYVSKKDYDALKLEFEQMKSQMQALTKRNAPAMDGAAYEDLSKQVAEAKQLAKDSLLGSTKFHVGGYAAAGFSDVRGGDAAFTANFNPILLWKLSDRLLFEGELELQLEGNSTSTALEMAQISYLLNDYMTIGAGKFLNPMNYFVERQHMAWVNKLPDKPLAVYDGLLPESMLGVQLRGAIPAGPTKFGYAFYVANAPSLIVEGDDASTIGTLEYNNFDNANGHIAVGGRVGFYPIPELELGYGFQLSDVGPAGNSADALLQSVDLSYVHDSSLLKGVVNFHTQWVWSQISGVNYDTGGGAFTFPNRRNGGYVQLAYRPTHFGSALVRDFEPVIRYDRLSQAQTPVGYDQQRWTFGLNYWLGASTVVKVAYSLDDKTAGAGNADTFWLQFAMGF